MPPITKEHAKKIIKKLKATVIKNRDAHDLAEFYHDGALVCSFGVRRSSRKSIGHGFIPNDLHISHHDTLDLANCPLSLEKYIEILREKGLIAAQEQTD